MKEMFTKYYKDILLVLGYTAAAIVIYSFWAKTIWHIWWVNLIISLGICIIGVISGIIYIKALIKRDNQQQIETTN